jgi:uncharacterized membrane protein YkgB
MGDTIKKRLLSISIGIVYLWFGALKFVPSLSPAEDLAKNTIHQLSFDLVPDTVSIFMLATWEVALGFMLLFGLWKRQAVILGLIHMVCTFSPLIFFPEATFGEALFSLTLVGQYIIKNLIIVAVLLSIYERKPAKETSIPKSEIPKPALFLIVLAIKNRFKKV